MIQRMFSMCHSPFYDEDGVFLLRKAGQFILSGYLFNLGDISVRDLPLAVG